MVVHEVRGGRLAGACEFQGGTLLVSPLDKQIEKKNKREEGGRENRKEG